MALTGPGVAMSGPVLTATGLVRSFGGRYAVTGADVALHPGTVTGLVGPNGAGKTTLLLMLAGLLAPDGGRIEFDGAPVDHTRLRRTTGWMPDAFGTWESLTPREILVAFGKLYGMPGAAADARTRELLALVHLEEFTDHPASGLSRGQKQRLGLARALINHPRILLLDEPASGMDPRSRIELRHLLRRLADAGTAILVSSHILSELDEMADHIVLMRAGSTQVPQPMQHASWRIRRAGEPPDRAVTVELTDDNAAAQYLAKLIGDGHPIAEFSRVGTDLEQVYLDLDAERT
ncbi:ABC transporter ATP-binding protein [Gordonia sp. (in: high G+C Gram-positive bacteria)]|uniref:ABC transporter ATP-binding protein n=1 Tax=Gordonia sp. (in: high G+C Gram-positive bacteria) TaxID=84139 RepID=UPI0025C4CEDE|nr:ABC transporter ATP-binding protein [Gordonia sp. (in: high G+C Gram-positive bacteria)]